MGNVQYRRKQIHDWKNYSRKATLCTPAISKRLRQRMFLHMSRSSLRTM